MEAFTYKQPEATQQKPTNTQILTFSQRSKNISIVMLIIWYWLQDMAFFLCDSLFSPSQVYQSHATVILNLFSLIPIFGPIFKLFPALSVFQRMKNIAGGLFNSQALLPTLTITHQIKGSRAGNIFSPKEIFKVCTSWLDHLLSIATHHHHLSSA